MGFNKARGDQMIALGSLGEVHCRPGFEALEAIDDPNGRGTLTDRFRRLVFSPSITDVVDVIYYTHLCAASDGAAGKGKTNTYTRDQIGAAVVQVKINNVREQCVTMLATAFDELPGDGDDDEQSENPPIAGTATDTPHSDSSA